MLGEIESREGEFLEARRWFTLGIERDPRYTPLYHEAALFEAKLGNLEVSLFIYTHTRIEISMPSTGRNTQYFYYYCYILLYYIYFYVCI